MFRRVLSPLSPVLGYHLKPPTLTKTLLSDCDKSIWRCPHISAAIISANASRNFVGPSRCHGWNHGYGRNNGKWQWWKSGSKKEWSWRHRMLLGGGMAGGSLRIFGFFEPQDEETVEESIIMSMKKAILAIQRENLDLAEKHLTQALSQSRKHGLEDAVTQVLDMQANLAFAKNELERAENLFKLVVQRLVGPGKASVTDNSIVEISIKLCEAYTKLGRTEEAIIGLQYCIKIQREKILKQGLEDENTLLLAGWALDNLSHIYLTEGNTVAAPEDETIIRQAKSLSEEAYKYVVKALGPEARQALTTRNNIATAHALLGEHETAIRILRELEVLARDSHEGLYADIVISIGNLYLEKANFDEAKEVCTQAKSIASRFKDMAAFERAEKCILKSVNLKNSQFDAQAG